jgi:hypothetical protein
MLVTRVLEAEFTKAPEKRASKNARRNSSGVKVDTITRSSLAAADALAGAGAAKFKRALAAQRPE